MSGIEIIGLLFGALTLIEPIAKGVKSASAIAKGSASYHDYIHDTSLEYHCFAQIFRNESRRIFGCFMTEAQIDQMFGSNGLKDPRWQDDNWKNDVRDYLGVFYKEISLAMELVFRTLSLLNEDIVRLTELDELPSPGETPNCGIHINRLSLRIEFKPRAKPKRISSTLNRTDFEAPNLSSCFKLPVPLGQPTNQHTETQRIDTVLAASTAAAKNSKFKRSVAFARNSLLSAIPSTKEDENIEEASNQKTIISEEISDLFVWLQRLRNPNTQNEGCRAGVITMDEDIECLIYEDDIDLGRIGTKKYESLLSYLSSGRDVLSTTQRLELAHTLAISLLRLHSSPWIDRSWSSKDVMLLLPPDASEAEREWSSYVAAAFNDIAKIQKIARAENPGKSGYKLSYVVSLGIIFLEIGLSRSLSHPDAATENAQDIHFDAYMKACAEVKFHSVMCMGPTYDRVVEICVKWIDSDELDDEVVRRKFYEEVVLGLERCIKVANSSSERRRRRTREYSRSPEHREAVPE
ncbi:hypothetical protein H072_6357 [Dactylellina haptotyla CBS 200.50]|uniref:DUF7580 domain-containing protein n=1 Tax=Dactylellina haptotyla (strain CBS 200.50) TaxID=1284197 RepID=S8BKM8_DACHA|nr:hypothetical protein H072_6357 [Dactylellina haptotyla CBS 200.50]